MKRRLSWAELRAEVARPPRLGAGLGDLVGTILPNMPEAIVSEPATASISADWSSRSPDFRAPTSRLSREDRALGSGADRPIPSY
jgi:acyl-coenzyme A synthetase/AMP-(fatty) acid ligase